MPVFISHYKYIFYPLSRVKREYSKCHPQIRCNIQSIVSIRLRFTHVSLWMCVTIGDAYTISTERIATVQFVGEGANGNIHLIQSICCCCFFSFINIQLKYSKYNIHLFKLLNFKSASTIGSSFCFCVQMFGMLVDRACATVLPDVWLCVCLCVKESVVICAKMNDFHIFVVSSFKLIRFRIFNYSYLALFYLHFFNSLSLTADTQIIISFLSYLHTNTCTLYRVLTRTHTHRNTYGTQCSSVAS